MQDKEYEIKLTKMELDAILSLTVSFSSNNTKAVLTVSSVVTKVLDKLNEISYDALNPSLENNHVVLEGVIKEEKKRK